MAHPYVEPTEATAQLAIQSISDELSVFDDWLERYQHIMELGRKLPAFPQIWMDDRHRVPGCQSQVWMQAKSCKGRINLAGASDAAIVSGLVALLLRVYSGRTPQRNPRDRKRVLKRPGTYCCLVIQPRKRRLEYGRSHTGHCSTSAGRR